MTARDSAYEAAQAELAKQRELARSIEAETKGAHNVLSVLFKRLCVVCVHICVWQNESMSMFCANHALVCAALNSSLCALTSFTCPDYGFRLPPGFRAAIAREQAERDRLQTQLTRDEGQLQFFEAQIQAARQAVTQLQEQVCGYRHSRWPSVVLNAL